MSNQLAAYALDAPAREQRLAALRGQMARHHSGALAMPAPTENVNNHIHTIYSFSPYSPAEAAYQAWTSGLTTAGIMDHDSVAGGWEFIEAGRVIGIATTVGMECRCSLAGTPFAGKRVNNPDQKSVAYLALHGIPHQSIQAVQAYMAPYRAHRNARNRTMTDRLNQLLSPNGLSLSFDADIAAASQAADGGSVTERHILFALTGKLIEQVGNGEALLRFLAQALAITVTGGSRDRLLEPYGPLYQYDLLGVLKAHLVERFYVEATDECPHVDDFLHLAKATGAIAAYPYLGDVAGSITGDKRDQTFEDSYLGELVPWLAGRGFHAVTYMPTRNTLPQLERLMALCHSNDLLEISGEDINSPRQPFVCAALETRPFRHLRQSTWALIGHERAATRRLCDGMFSPQTLESMPALADRIAHFAAIGSAPDPGA